MRAAARDIRVVVAREDEDVAEVAERVEELTRVKTVDWFWLGAAILATAGVAALYWMVMSGLEAMARW